MNALLTALAILSVPFSLFAVAAALLGFLCRPLFLPMLATASLAMFWVCKAFATGERFAPLFVLPLVAAHLSATLASVWLRRAVEEGCRREGARMQERRDA